MARSALRPPTLVKPSASAGMIRVTTPAGSSWSMSSSTDASPTSDSSTTSSIIPLVAPSYGRATRAPGTISFFEPVPRDVDDVDSEDATARKKPRKKRAGWGPYQSVLRERSVDFNLTLDIQNLKQEIQNMETFRDILLSKTLIQRHDPEGSLVRKTKDHYRVMRSGFNLSETGRKRAYKEQDQKEFIRSIFDPDVDVGNGASGIATLIEQIKLYSVFINFISITMTDFEIVMGEDSVLVATKGILHFQITRTTIASMFPHVLGEEWLVSKLVGQEVYADSTMDFYFNSSDKVNRFAVNLDYVKTFIDILKNPLEVDILLGRALIDYNNCMIGFTDEDELPPSRPQAQSANSEDDASPDLGFDSSSHSEEGVVATPARESDPASTGVSTAADPVAGDEVAESLTATAETSKTTKSRAKRPKTTKKATVARAEAASSPTSVLSQPQVGPLTPAEHFESIVKQYFLVFANGAESAAAVSETQRTFLLKHFAPTVGYGSVVGHQVMEDRWRSLCWCFGALNFKQLSQEPLACTPIENLYSIQCSAEYMMLITVRTIEQVFPHVLADETLVDSVVGTTLTVSAQLTFWLEKDTGLVGSITEQMDFDAALSRIIGRPDDLSFVLSRARPTLYGFVGEVVAADPEPPVRENDKSQHDTPRSPVSPASVASSSASAKMRLTNILG